MNGWTPTIKQEDRTDNEIMTCIEMLRDVPNNTYYLERLSELMHRLLDEEKEREDGAQ